MTSTVSALPPSQTLPKSRRSTAALYDQSHEVPVDVAEGPHAWMVGHINLQDAVRGQGPQRPRRPGRTHLPWSTQSGPAPPTAPSYQSLDGHRRGLAGAAEIAP